MSLRALPAFKISARLASSVGYHMMENTKPPAGAKGLELLETLNLVYAF